MPDEARGTSRAAAKAFVRHYVASVNHAMRTGDTASLSALADPDCATCNAVVQRIDDVYSDGGRLEGPGWTVIGLEYYDTPDGRTALVGAAIRIAPQKAYSAEGQQPKRTPASNGHLDFTLEARPIGWGVRRLEATQ